MNSIQRISKTACWLASMAYASGYKRAGRNYLSTAFMAQIVLNDEAHVVMSGALPSACRV